MYHISIHSFVNGHLFCFHVLAIVNSASVNIVGKCILLNYVFFWVYAQEWDCWIISQLYFQFFEKLPYFKNIF